MIPYQFHFCSFKPEGISEFKPFGYSNYLCLLSIIKAHPGAKFNLYVNEPIESAWYDILSPVVDQIIIVPPKAIFGQSIQKVEHMADIARLNILYEHGGIYMDTDVFIRRPINDLTQYKFVMGIENGMGLCNGVIFSEKKSPFIKEWLNAYDPKCKRMGAGFDPEGWGEMSVKFPELLAKEFEGYIHILPASAFFQPSGSDRGLEILFDSTEYECHESFGNHLWASRAREPYLNELRPEDILSRKGYFYKMVRETLTENEIRGNVDIRSIVSDRMILISDV